MSGVLLQNLLSYLFQTLVVKKKDTLTLDADGEQLKVHKSKPVVLFN